jgi:hypothetical protein
VIELTGPGRVWRLYDRRAQRILYFDLDLASGEVATLDLRPESRSFVSSVNGSIMHTILPGSDLGSFRTSPGVTSFYLFAEGTITATWTMQERYSSGTGKLLV